MTLLSFASIVRSGLCALIVLAVDPSYSYAGKRDSKDPDTLPLSPAYVEVPGVTTIQPVYATVEWEGKEYEAIEGISVLMRVIEDPRTEASRRTEALKRLGSFRNRGPTPQLIALYDRLTQRQEKLEAIRCFIASKDPRAFPLLAGILQQEQDEMARLYAAVALSQWNVRCGVAELIGIHDGCKDAKSAQSDICKEAANEFAWFNSHKGWGFPQEQVRKALLARSDVSDDQRRELYLGEIRNWWSQNKHRFPEWKPGDPLPEVPAKQEASPEPKP